MDAMERRCQIIEILCDAKMHVKMRDLASRFNVSVRTIRTDVDFLSVTYPIETTRGRYNGGISFIEGYSPRKARLTKIRANLRRSLSGASAARRWSIGAGHGFRLLMTIKSNVFCLFDSERSPQFCIRNCGLLSIAQRIMALPHSTATGRFHSGAPPCAGTGRPQPSAPAGSLAAPPFRPSAPRYDPPRPRCASDGR